MSTRFGSCVLGFLILMTCSNLTMGDDWNTAYQQSTGNTDLTKAWTSTGDWTPHRQAITVSSEQEAMLRFNQSLADPVIQVQFDFTYSSETFTQEGILIGLSGGGRRSAAQFILHGGERPTAQLIVPARAPVVVDSLNFTPGKTYHITANVNGQTAELFINGTKIAQRQMMTKLATGQVALFARQGDLSFANLQIRTKKISDAQLAERAREQARGHAIKAQFQDGYIPPIWDPSQITFKQRSARIRLKQVPLKAQSILATPGNYPLSVGVPITDRHMFKAQQFRLLDAEGEPIACQITPTALWEQEGAIKWVIVDANVQIDDPLTPVELTLEYGRSVRDVEPLQTMPITDSDTHITVDSGKLKVTFSKTTGTLIDAATLDGKPVMVPDSQRGGYFVDNNDQTYRTSGKDDQYKLVVEVAGSLHTILRATGWYVNDAGQKACRYTTRIHLYKDQPMLRMEHTWIVTLDTDPFWFKDLGLNLPMSIAAASKAMVSVSNEKLTQSITQTLEGKTLSLTQNDLAKSTVTHANKQLSISAQTGGWVSLLGQDTGVTVTVRDMAMQFPNQLDVTENGIKFHAWKTLQDKELNFRHEGIAKLWGQKTWQRMNENVISQGALESRVSNGLGFARTHHLTLAFHEPKEAQAQIAGALGQYEPIASVDPQWIKNSKSLPLILPTYDEDRFAAYETQIKEKFDEYVQVANHLDPMIGFWDYGRGCPQDLAPPGSSPQNPLGTSKGWTYSGINANDDMSYGNPQLPWLLYLRSGDRKYLRRARAMTTHVMDTRIIHWHNKSLGREIGQSYKRTGTWVFDGSDAGWTGDIWAGFLATAYQVTGYQRSLDVLGEIANGYAHTNRPVQNHQTVTYLGAIARYYTSTWDKKLLDILVQTAPVYLQSQLETGFWAQNDQAFEYTLLELLMLPNIEQSWENTAMNFARGAIGPMRFHTHWALAAGVQAWAYTNKQPDARFGGNAIEALANGIPKLTGYANLSPLRSSLVWMGLSDIPGIADIVQPVIITFARPQESVFYLKHQAGRKTHIELH
ncbi:MAG: hypothetical protein JKX85_08800, partial [Phycisphaeraceae bacterium]|nr:hypothetical protein [Phycisphaeraceae bacterium]